MPLYMYQAAHNEGMAAIALAIGAAIKASKTTVLMSGTQRVDALKKADAAGKVYRPAR